MNRLSTSARAQIVAALVEGMSIRAVSRMTGRSKNTITKLLADLGQACAAYHDEHVRGLQCEQVQADEIWAFCYSKAKNVPEQHKGEFGYGDVWTWTAIDADSKLMVSWLVGERNAYWAGAFIDDVASRMASRPQISTDGLAAYRWAIGSAFNGQVDHAIIKKVYGDAPGPKGRYSPAQCTGIEKKVGIGNPDMEKASTSYVERSNLTMRMGMRRFTRLTNAFSKKVANLEAAVSLHFMHYNFCRKHQTLKTTPAVKAGLADHVWSVEELIGVLEAQEREDSK